MRRRTLRAYRADVEIKRAPLPPSVRANLLAAGARTYADILSMDSSTVSQETMAWARERDALERARKLAEDLAG